MIMAMNKYFLNIVPGLGQIAVAEAWEQLGVRPKSGRRLRNTELLELDFDGQLQGLLNLRTVEDVFVALGTLRLSGQPTDLKALERAPFWGTPLRQALKAWEEAMGRAVVKRQVFRVVVQAEDATWRRYRRSDLGLAAERAVLGGSSWRLNREAAPLEIWLQQAGRELLASLRLSTGAMRQHGGREVERGAALRPSVAAALVRLTQPDDDDVFLDPMCGTGTLLLERAVAGRYQLLLGGDIDSVAVEATLANFGPRHQPRRIERWDATKLPLEDGSVNKLACNLPWGRQVSEQAALPSLYAGVLHEAARVMVSGGRIVLLTSEWKVLKEAIKDQPEFQLEQTVSNFEILGRRADIFCLRRS